MSSIYTEFTPNYRNYGKGIIHMVKDKDYEEWAVVTEAARFAHIVGLEKLLTMIEKEYEELGEMNNPRFYGPDRDAE